VVTSSRPGSFSILSRISGASRYSDSVSPLCITYWYWLFEIRPPILRFWIGWKNACMPGICRALARSRPMIALRLSRSFFGFSARNRRP
jgi:hypothetical protein